MSIYPAGHAQTCDCETTKTGPWREFILSSVSFTVYVLSGFRSSRQPGTQINKLSGQIKQAYSLQVPSLNWSQI